MISYRNIEEGGEHSFADYLQTPEPSSVVIPGGAKRRPGIHSGSNGGDSRLRGNDDLRKGIVPFLLLSFEASLEVRAWFYLLSIELPCLKRGK